MKKKVFIFYGEERLEIRKSKYNEIKGTDN